MATYNGHSAYAKSVLALGRATRNQNHQRLKLYTAFLREMLARGLCEDVGPRGRIYESSEAGYGIFLLKASSIKSCSVAYQWE